MEENARSQMIFEANRKSVGVTYLLWFFLGMLGAHRFYAGSTKTAIMQLVLAISIIGWLVLIPWLLIDIVLIPGLVRDHNMEVIDDLTGSDTRPPHPAERRPLTEADRKREAILEDLRHTGYRKQPRDNSHLYR